MKSTSIQEFLNDSSISNEVRNRNKLFLEWNSLSEKLKELDRTYAIKTNEEKFKNDKILSGSETLRKSIILKKNNLEFIEFLYDLEIDSIAFKHFKRIFDSYQCLSSPILQHSFVPQFLRKKILEIENKKIQQVILLRFDRLISKLEENRIIPKQKNRKGNNLFTIKRTDIEYFGVTNYQIVNCLNKTPLRYQLNNDELGNLKIVFEKGERELGILKINLLTTKLGVFPFWGLGLFSQQST